MEMGKIKQITFLPKSMGEVIFKIEKHDFWAFFTAKH